jgi:hypothetical protein
MALVGALCLSLNAVIGFTNRSLRAEVSRLLGQAYTVHQMSTDLGRLRLNGLINRLEGTNRDTLTSDGLRVAIFYTKLYQRLLQPLLAADTPPAPDPLRAALAIIDQHVENYTQQRSAPRHRLKLKINVDDRSTKLRQNCTQPSSGPSAPARSPCNTRSSRSRPRC